MLVSDRMEADHTKQALRSMLVQRSLILGPITLSSGAQSNHYFDCKRVTLSSEGAELIGEAVLHEIQDLPEWPIAIGGLTHGADPIIGAVMMCALEHGKRIDGFYVRKEPKQHGTRSVIENVPAHGSGVVIVDDVVTGGGSVLQAVTAAKQAGCRILAVITIIDRLEGGADRIKAEVANYIPLYTLDDFRSDIERGNCPRDTTKSDPLLTGASL
ncbi:MAG TPA: orotate phosphoribosyltransferase [Candidatus Binatia bacterium]|nr:orotate phosphoribosyltransferase [Candidatus Binatia bacterium]